MNWPWSELGLPGPAGLPEIRRAYSQRLKTTHPEDDPEGFQRLHAAYQAASRYARQAGRAAEKPAFDPPEEPEGKGAAGGRPGEPLRQGGEAEWDYDELLKGQESPRKPPEKAEQPQKPDWDYDELLNGDAKSPQEPEASQREAQQEAQDPDWDYERLFAEGEAEAQAARRRKLEELRRKNQARFAAQEREQRKRAADEEETWSAVMAAAHALELLHSTGAPLLQWKRFLNDSVFWNVRANLDFIFALEDFLEQHPDLSPDIRRAIFSAYEFEKGPGYPVYRRLYQLLRTSQRKEPGLRGALGRWRNRWRNFPVWRKVSAFFLLLGVCLIVFGLSDAGGAERSAQKWQAQALAWLEEDFGQPFIRPLDAHENLYAPAAEPTLYFWVLQDGERTEDWPGYRTDYPHIRVMKAMQDFAGQWELGLEFDSAGGFSGNIGDAPGAYLFDLPLLGAGEAITALGELVEELEAQDWYRILEDKYGGEIIYQIFLCHKGLSFYDAISTRDGGFDADYARARYETQVGAAFCRYLLEESGLAARHMGEDAYVLLDQGTVELSDQTFFWVSGLDKEEYKPQAQYLMDSGGKMLFCLPEGELEKVKTVTDLYRGSLSNFQLDGVGLVVVYDQLA